jgi:hypothetical protein
MGIKQNGPESVSILKFRSVGGEDHEITKAACLVWMRN